MRRKPGDDPRNLGALADAVRLLGAIVAVLVEVFRSC